MKAHKFNIGERVVFYTGEDRLYGTITRHICRDVYGVLTRNFNTKAADQFTAVETTWTAHEKQLRRLKPKKERRRVWVKVNDAIVTDDWVRVGFTKKPQDAEARGLVEFIEVRGKK